MTLRCYLYGVLRLDIFVNQVIISLHDGLLYFAKWYFTKRNTTKRNETCTLRSENLYFVE